MWPGVRRCDLESGDVANEVQMEFKWQGAWFDREGKGLNFLGMVRRQGACFSQQGVWFKRNKLNLQDVDMVLHGVLAQGGIVK